MARPINYTDAKARLVEIFEFAEDDFRTNTPIEVPASIADATETLFASSTQSFREVLVGCALAHILDPEINIRLPYVSLGNYAFNGRTLDERVVNPFLHDKEIPCSRGPYLATFRRTVTFTEDTAKGVRDKVAYGAFLTIINSLETSSQDEAKNYLRYLLYSFVRLRDASRIALVRIHRLSLEQYENLSDSLLQTPSGGLLPVLLCVAMFKAINQVFDLNWDIEWQGINVADRPSGAGGDITIKKNDDIVLAVEITERPIDRSRIVSTFNTKISRHGIEDYIFLFVSALPNEGACAAARTYFAQGHDINFLPVKDWLINLLGTISPRGREAFNNEFMNLMERSEVPASLKVAWNECIRELLQS